MYKKRTVDVNDEFLSILITMGAGRGGNPSDWRYGGRCRFINNQPNLLFIVDQETKPS